MTGYATTTLSGDVAAAMQLLRRVTKPTTKAQKRGLILPLHELAACEARPISVSCKWLRTHVLDRSLAMCRARVRFEVEPTRVRVLGAALCVSLR